MKRYNFSPEAVSEETRVGAFVNIQEHPGGLWIKAEEAEQQIDDHIAQIADLDRRLEEALSQPALTLEGEAFVDGCLQFLPGMEWVMSTYRAAVARPDSTAPGWLGELVSLYDRLMEQSKVLFPEQTDAPSGAETEASHE